LVSVLRASWAGAHHDEKDSNRSSASKSALRGLAIVVAWLHCHLRVAVFAGHVVGESIAQPGRASATNGLVSLLVLATIALVDGYSRSCEDPSKYPTVNLDRWIWSWSA
jgi:hypothetical protein